MSFEEKGTWVTAFVTLGAYIAYVAIVLGKAAAGTPLPDVPYQSTLLWTIAIVIVLSIIGHIAAAISNPGEADKKDIRDREIYRYGEYIGGTVLGIGILLPLGLAMAEFDPFWIANGIFLVGVISSTVAAIVKIVAYRRGL
jgi:hypothetical protein